MNSANQDVSTFGEYTEIGEDAVKGRCSLILSFQSDTLNMDELWESSALSATQHVALMCNTESLLKVFPQIVSRRVHRA